MSRRSLVIHNSEMNINNLGAAYADELEQIPLQPAEPAAGMAEQ
jgi:hypothetical protein